MTDRNIPTCPLACVPGAIPESDREAHFALIRMLFDETADERMRLEAGYAFRFPAAALEALARFIANERKCCPFLAFTIDLAPYEGSLWLRITGPNGTPEFLEAEFRM